MPRVLAVGLLLLAVHHSAWATQEATSALADSLFLHGRYYEAATEYGRFLFRCSLFTDSADSSRASPEFVRPAQLKLIQAYARNGELSRAEERLAALPPTADCWDARFDLAQAYIRDGEFGNARAELQTLRSVGSDSLRSRKSSRELGWLAIEQGDFGLAAADFGRSGDSTLADECRGLAGLPTRSPVLAMLASTVVPGSGEVYAGAVGLGLASFAANAAVIAGVVYCVDRKLYLDAALLATVLFGRFYSGSRSNAYDLARDFNERQRQSTARELKRRYGR
jgi:hypothetical protein